MGHGMRYLDRRAVGATRASSATPEAQDRTPEQGPSDHRQRHPLDRPYRSALARPSRRVRTLAECRHPLLPLGQSGRVGPGAWGATTPGGRRRGTGLEASSRGWERGLDAPARRLGEKRGGEKRESFGGGGDDDAAATTTTRQRRQGREKIRRPSDGAGAGSRPRSISVSKAVGGSPCPS